MLPLEEMFRGKTFDDFLIRPQFSVLESRKAADLSMPLTGKITLALPIIGANMDTVVGGRMMKALSLEGAFGFLHRNCSIEEQVEMVDFVKRQHAYILVDPLVLDRRTPLGQAKREMEQLRVSGILVEDGPGSRVLAGVLSHRDISPFDTTRDHEPIENFMTPFDRLVTALQTVAIDEAEHLMYENRKEKLPLIEPATRQIVGLITMRDLKLSKQKPLSSKDARGRLLVGATIGSTRDYMERAEALLAMGADCILMDIAHAHSKVMETAIRSFRAKWPEANLVVGNVATGEGAKFLMDLGVDAIKVGVGPGRGCRTRLEVGAGVPQLQAIREAWCATSGKVPLIADGGVRNDKDIILAIACGASTVMLGSKLAGTDEAPGRVITDPKTKQKVKSYRGMTSPQAVLENSGRDNVEEALATPQEGQSLEVPYSGSVVEVLREMLGHIQSHVSYTGFRSLSEAHEKISARPGRYLEALSEASKRESFDR